LLSEAGDLETAGKPSVRVTGIVWGELPAAGSLIVMVAEWFPAGSSEVSYMTAIVSCSPVEVPLAGLHDNQSASSVIVYESAPPPEFQTSKLWVGASSLNWHMALSEVGLRESEGCPTDKLTGIVCGVFVEPVAVTVMAAE